MIATTTTFPSLAFYGVLLIAGTVLALSVPTLFPVGVIMVAAAAVLGAVHRVERPGPLMVRSVLLGATAFTYPLFLGGRLIPMLAVLAHLTLIAIGWVGSDAARARIALPQALAAGLGCGIAAAATQFFWPLAWRGVAAVAVVVFFVLLLAAVPDSWVERSPTPYVCAGVLALSEGIVLLRFLPMHWTVNGALIALAFAAIVAVDRRAQFFCTVAMVLVFAVALVIPG